MTSTKSRVNQGISFEPELLPAAKAKAAKNRQSFSAYINALLAADLGCELSATTADKPANPAHPQGSHHPAAA